MELKKYLKGPYSQQLLNSNKFPITLNLLFCTQLPGTDHTARFAFTVSPSITCVSNCWTISSNKETGKAIFIKIYVLLVQFANKIIE